MDFLIFCQNAGNANGMGESWMWIAGAAGGMMLTFLVSRILEVMKTKGVDLPKTCYQMDKVYEVLARPQNAETPSMVIEKLNQIKDSCEKTAASCEELLATSKAHLELDEIIAEKASQK